MPCSNGAWRFLPLPDRARHKYKKARNYAGLAGFYAFRCLTVPDVGSLPLDRQQDKFCLFLTRCYAIHSPLIPLVIPSNSSAFAAAIQSNPISIHSVPRTRLSQKLLPRKSFKIGT